MDLDQRVFQAGDLVHEPKEIARPYSYLEIRWGKGDQILPGPVDRSDKSHISIQCIINSKTTTINGWLKDDDRVVWDQQFVGDPLQR